jgi:hypothetical protein
MAVAVAVVLKYLHLYTQHKFWLYQSFVPWSYTHRYCRLNHGLHKLASTNLGKT